MKENELTSMFVSHFSQWFKIEPEQWSDCGKGRIDYIITCKKSEAVFGVECKRPGNKKGTGAGDIILQCVKYSLMTFKGVRIPVFLVPAFSKNQFVCPIDKITHTDGFHYYKEKHNQEDHTHHTFNGFLGAFNVGEIRKMTPEKWPTYHIFSFSNQVIFSTKHYGNQMVGLHQKNYETLITKINNPFIETIFKLKEQ